MGYDIHAWVEKKVGDTWYVVSSDIFDNRCYGVFGFLANVRNYSEVPCISGEPKGMPEDASIFMKELWDNSLRDWCHTPSWLTLKELLEFDYSQTFQDMRTMAQESSGVWNGAARSRTGGETKVLRDFLGQWFFDEVDKLKKHGSPDEVRVVFCFDN